MVPVNAELPADRRPDLELQGGQTPDSQAPATGSGQHILYIDDEEPLLYLVRRTLVRNGYRVSTFTDSSAALEAFRAEPSAFDLVLTDYNLPGMSGLDVAREVRAVRSDIPVAMISGFIDEELRAAAKSTGVGEVLSKSIDLNDVDLAVTRLLNLGVRTL